MSEGLHADAKQDVKPYECPTCLKRFKCFHTIECHRELHAGVKQFLCQLCDRSCASAASLSIHMRVHTGERPYKCSYPGCCRDFPQLNNLQWHFKKAHGIDKPASPLKMKTKNTARKSFPSRPTFKRKADSYTNEGSDCEIISSPSTDVYPHMYQLEQKQNISESSNMVSQSNMSVSVSNHEKDDMTVANSSGTQCNSDCGDSNNDKSSASKLKRPTSQQLLGYAIRRCKKPAKDRILSKTFNNEIKSKPNITWVTSNNMGYSSSMNDDQCSGGLQSLHDKTDISTMDSVCAATIKRKHDPELRPESGMDLLQLNVPTEYTLLKKSRSVVQSNASSHNAILNSANAQPLKNNAKLSLSSVVSEIKKSLPPAKLKQLLSKAIKNMTSPISYQSVDLAKADASASSQTYNISDLCDKTQVTNIGKVNQKENKQSSIVNLCLESDESGIDCSDGITERIGNLSDETMAYSDPDSDHDDACGDSTDMHSDRKHTNESVGNHFNKNQDKNSNVIRDDLQKVLCMQTNGSISAKGVSGVECATNDTRTTSDQITVEIATFTPQLLVCSTEQSQEATSVLGQITLSTRVDDSITSNQKQSEQQQRFTHIPSWVKLSDTSETDKLHSIDASTNEPTTVCDITTGTEKPTLQKLANKSKYPSWVTVEDTDESIQSEAQTQYSADETRVSQHICAISEEDQTALPVHSLVPISASSARPNPSVTNTTDLLVTGFSITSHAIPIKHIKLTSTGMELKTFGLLNVDLFFTKDYMCIKCLECQELMQPLTFLKHHDNVPQGVKILEQESLEKHSIEYVGILKAEQWNLWVSFIKSFTNHLKTTGFSFVFPGMPNACVQVDDTDVEAGDSVSAVIPSTDCAGSTDSRLPSMLLNKDACADSQNELCHQQLPSEPICRIESVRSLRTSSPMSTAAVESGTSVPLDQTTSSAGLEPSPVVQINTGNNRITLLRKAIDLLIKNNSEIVFGNNNNIINNLPAMEDNNSSHMVGKNNYPPSATDTICNIKNSSLVVPDNATHKTLSNAENLADKSIMQESVSFLEHLHDRNVRVLGNKDNVSVVAMERSSHMPDINNTLAMPDHINNNTLGSKTKSPVTVDNTVNYNSIRDLLNLDSNQSCTGRNVLTDKNIFHNRQHVSASLSSSPGESQNISDTPRSNGTGLPTDGPSTSSARHLSRLKSADNDNHDIIGMLVRSRQIERYAIIGLHTELAQYKEEVIRLKVNQVELQRTIALLQAQMEEMKKKFEQDSAK